MSEIDPSQVRIQIDDRDQQFTVFIQGIHAGQLHYSLANSVVELQKLELTDGFDDAETRDAVIGAVMAILEREDDTMIRPCDPAVNRWVSLHPEFYDLLA